jgi:hypothetical protein
MGGVDIADQLRSYFNTQRSHVRTWKPLFHFLLNTIIGNCYLLSSYRPTDRRATRREGHKRFRRDLRDALYKHLTRRRNPPTLNQPTRRSTKEILWYAAREHKLMKLFIKAKLYSACIEAGRKTTRAIKGQRRNLSDLSPNTVRKPRDSQDWKRPERAPRTHYGCSVCQIPFCRKDEC